MTLRNPSLVLCALAALTGIVREAAASPQERTSSPRAPAGVDFTFRRSLYNGYGLSSLSELRGKPVLIEYWSHHCPPCVNAAVPGALRLQEEHGNALQVVMCEAGLSSENQVLSYALNKRWLTTGTMWTTENPVPRDAYDLPYYVLLDAEGQVVTEGVAVGERDRDLDQAVAQVVKETAKGPRELTRELAKAVTESSDGNFAKAREIALAEVTAAGDDGIRVQEAKRVLATVEERLDQRLKRTRWMLDNGYPIEATDALDALAKGVKGWVDPEARVGEMTLELGTDEMKVELEAQKALQKIEKKLFEDPDVRWVKQLQKIVERYPRTKTADRAKQLAKIASI
jgi:thiol-disulfide isomerase/thioredoxin